MNFPDFPETHAFGDDEDDAIVRAQDALATKKLTVQPHQTTEPAQPDFGIS